MAIMIDVCANNDGAEYKRKNYQRVIDTLRDCNTPIHTISDVTNIVQCGSRIRRKIEYIMEFGTDLPEVKEYLENSLEEDECSDCSSEHSYDSVTTQCPDSEEEDDDPLYEHEEDDEDDNESVGSNDTDSTQSEDADDDTESVGSNDTDSTQSEDADDDTESVGSNDTDSIKSEDDTDDTESVGTNKTEALCAIDTIESLLDVEKKYITILTEQNALTLDIALKYLQTVREYVLTTL